MEVKAAPGDVLALRVVVLAGGALMEVVADNQGLDPVHIYPMPDDIAPWPNAEALKRLLALLTRCKPYLDVGDPGAWELDDEIDEERRKLMRVLPDDPAIPLLQKVILQTRDGGPVTEGLIPPFSELPTVVLWGMRTFGIWLEGPPPVYREVFATAVLDTAPPDDAS